MRESIDKTMTPHQDLSGIPARDTALEALRGAAAFVVVLWHLMLGFAPARSGQFLAIDPDAALDGRWWFGLLNGNAAVAFFFVLSGFVLCRRSFVERDSSRIPAGVLKRWPRLAGPVAVVCFASWILVRTHAYAYADAAAITGSPWLVVFGFSPHPPGPHASLLHALFQGGYGAFFEGETDYDSSLWTMRYEFIGSFIAFGLAMTGARASRPMQACLFATAVLLAGETQPFYVDFVAGAALAAFLPARNFRTPLLVIAVSLCLVLYLAGYSSHAAGCFRWIHHDLGNPNCLYVYALAAVLAIALVETHEGLHALLSRPIAGWIGRLSFPLYLVHVPVLCSIGCRVYLALAGSDPLAAKLAAIAATIVVSILVAMPLARFDVWWTSRIGEIARRLESPRPSLAIAAVEPLPIPRSAAARPAM